MWDTLTHKWLRVPYSLQVSANRTVKHPVATILFIHGIGNSGEAWDDVIAKLPPNVNVLTIDLLGFGMSPKPTWAIYNAKTQARSVIATLVKLRLSSRLIVVGHSLGALIAVEVAKRYPLLVKSLILCSPPFYSDRHTDRRMPNGDTILKNFYRKVQQHPEEFLKFSAVAKKYGLVNKSFNVTRDHVGSYMGALEASIVNQTSLEDAKKLNKPMTIIHGTLDPVVIRRNLKELTEVNANAELKTIVAGHEVKGRYVPFLVRTIIDTLPKK